MRSRALLCALGLLFATTLLAGDFQTDTTERILGSRAPVLIQAGEKLQMMAVTDEGSFNFTTADLHVVDAGRPNKPARLIAKQAYVFYFPSHDRRGLVFTTDAADQPGLYLASARP